MKKTLTIKTISFKNQKNSTEESPLHATCRLLSRPQTVTTQRKSHGSKMSKGLSENHYKRLITEKTPKNSKNLFQNRNSQGKNRENKANKRYQNTANSQTEDINKSVIHFKLSSHHFQPMNTLSQESKKKEAEVTQIKKRSDNSVQIHRNRVNSQPNNSNDMKKQLMERVSKKLQLLRKMTIQSGTPTIQPIHYVVQSSKAKQNTNFFDKMYDHCLKKLKKDIVRYEKNLAKDKDQKYFELKFESSVLTKELIEIRKNIMKKIEEGENQSNMGIVGNLIDFNKTTDSFKVSRKKLSSGYGDKRNIKTKDQYNPYSADTRGWEVGEKHEQFYLC